MRSEAVPLPPRGTYPTGPVRRPSPWPAVVTYAIAFVLTMGSSFLVVFSMAWVRVSGLRSSLFAEANAVAVSPSGLMAAAFGNAVVLASVAFVAAWLSGRRVAHALRLRASAAHRVELFAASAGMVGLSVACGAASELLRVRAGGVMDAMELALRNPSSARFVLALATIAIAPGLAEEVFFRGWMQTRLAANWGRWPAVLVASAAFGLIHVDAVQGVAAFSAGLYLGWITERFDAIRPSIVAHIANNALFVALAAFGTSTADSRLTKLAALLIGAAVWSGSVAVLRARPATTSTHVS